MKMTHSFILRIFITIYTYMYIQFHWFSCISRAISCYAMKKKKGKKMQQVTNYTHANEIDIYLRWNIIGQCILYLRFPTRGVEVARIEQLPLIKSRALPRVHVRELLFHAFPQRKLPPPPKREGQRSDQRRVKLTNVLMLKASSIRINWSWLNWLVISLNRESK